MDTTSTSRFPSTSMVAHGTQRNVPVLYPRDLAAAFINRTQHLNDSNLRKRIAPGAAIGLPKVINGEGMLRRVSDDGPIIVDQPMEIAPNICEADEKIPDVKEAPPPPALQFTLLPREFVQHFQTDFFRCDMNLLDILSKYIRENVDFLNKAATRYPMHPSFTNRNINAFERNLEVIRQAGEYFEPMLGFEDEKEFYPNAMSPMGTALTICMQNSTAMLDQFAPSPVDTEILPGCRLSKHGMLNLSLLLNGILTEAEGMIAEYEKWKSQHTVNRVKMMMMTLQFSRYYRLAGAFATSALATVDGEEHEKLASELNRITVVKLGDTTENFSDTDLNDEECYSDDEDAHQRVNNPDVFFLDALMPSESRSSTASGNNGNHSSTVSLPSTVTNSPDNS